MSFEADHRRRMEEASSLLAEMIPRPDEEVEEIRAEYRDVRYRQWQTVYLDQEEAIRLGRAGAIDLADR